MRERVTGLAVAGIMALGACSEGSSPEPEQPTTVFEREQASEHEELLFSWMNDALLVGEQVDIPEVDQVVKFISDKTYLGLASDAGISEPPGVDLEESVAVLPLIPQEAALHPLVKVLLDHPAPTVFLPDIRAILILGSPERAMTAEWHGLMALHEGSRAEKFMAADEELSLADERAAQDLLHQTAEELLGWEYKKVVSDVKDKLAQDMEVNPGLAIEGGIYIEAPATLINDLLGQVLSDREMAYRQHVIYVNAVFDLIEDLATSPQEAVALQEIFLRNLLQMGPVQTENTDQTETA